MARAQAALMNGDMQVMVLTDCTWMVASKSSRYTVSLDGDAWTCTCPDFTGRCQRFGLRCKHIEAVRLTETEKIAESGLVSQYTYPQFSTTHTEEPMTQSMPTHDPSTRPASSIRPASRSCGVPPYLRPQAAWQPLDMNRVKRRQARTVYDAPRSRSLSVSQPRRLVASGT
jgi:predicted nucleic acid-binding Zn finger protein